MIPVEPFILPAPGTREHNAVTKALKEKPTVVQRLALASETHTDRLFHVKEYDVRVFTDLDDQTFIECSCPAGTPPIDPDTKLPTREASPCYHAGAVLLFIAERENQLA